ncbi:MAG: uroporphyrinogen-III C-methyltransferase [Aigarchaeota archaeon]|nr:uroporphyrinogen-III C-methyltransferase [Aigarchaeota archaeon]MCX8192778.1 uroporphyrinogen-III C-methyltransferase [Nitrososphaeria archaeon]MDW7986025.1 uroporphyrinogen-III C-methyltransferase [Nitrososphaerota archaeon]
MGKVYLVGAGPGDPELITLKGLKILQKSDVVIYDRLVNEKILEYAVNAKEFICVGKEVGESWKQEEINKLLVEKARKYDNVVRLKNGDPMLFGRGGEECEVLKEAGISYEIIPGISSALAGPTYAGIPVTHREYSSSIAIVTGHRKEGCVDELDYLKKIFSSVDTTIILMGVSNLEKIVKIASSSLPPTTPIAIVENATLREQRVLTGDLQNIVEISQRYQVKPPAVIILGEVVTLREKLRWLE